MIRPVSRGMGIGSLLLLRWGPPFLLAAAFGAADEIHQIYEPHRNASAVDVGWDSLGAFFGLGSCWAMRGGEEQSRKANAPEGIPPGGVWLG